MALKGGRVYAMGRSEEVPTEDNLQKIYGVKVKVFQEYRAVVLDNFL
ncbi:hypothetical protein N186_05925 [Thermofilum adornatum]|uniref:ABC transporter ATP-binding protein n=2 Tax=Thermofilum adornatum TaxID=1365176 RepID=S5Z843_9CREN|nr:hypothetical protein N186_05925 [Thermofilum adornatum]AJB41322.1 hypothetical protein TCARB_0246 [Thermofilum adornatum 1505]